MPRAEVGTTKHVANQMKAKGLQRLRWYCQACSRQMRDENGFKCHVASESHVRNMMVIGEDPRKAINEFSNQFQRDFVQLLRTGHGEKKVNVNHFYQEYISNKEHIHMNATKWTSLTEFAKYLGREGICRVEEDEKNIERGGASALLIGWIDNSPEKLRRQEALKKRERQDRGDEEREQRMIAEQIKRARRDGVAEDDESTQEDDADAAEQREQAVTQGINRNGEEKVKLNFGLKTKAAVSVSENPPSPPLTEKSESPEQNGKAEEQQTGADTAQASHAADSKKGLKPMSLAPSKPKNIFAVAGKKTVFGGGKKSVPLVTKKPISEAERIMKEEIERKKSREQQSNGNGFKRQRVN